MIPSVCVDWCAGLSIDSSVLAGAPGAAEVAVNELVRFVVYFFRSGRDPFLFACLLACFTAHAGDPDPNQVACGDVFQLISLASSVTIPPRSLISLCGCAQFGHANLQDRTRVLVSHTISRVQGGHIVYPRVVARPAATQAVARDA